MPSDPSRLTLLALVVALSLVAAARYGRTRVPFGAYLRYLWVLLLAVAVADLLSFEVAVWVLAGLCFVALREYFTLVDIRLQDRWGVIGAYLSIPFMTYFIQTDWYGMFIISVPVYGFLVVPFLVALGGGEPRGTVLSIGAIDFGLFLLVYCVGHIGYLCLHSTWKAVFLILAVTASDLVAYALGLEGRSRLSAGLVRWAAAVPLTVGLGLATAPWSGIPYGHAAILGALVPALVGVASYTLSYVEADLGIGQRRLVPGRGQILDCIKSFVYAAPVVFHYVRYFLT